MPRIAYHTLGCKVNQYDTEAMIELFEKEGYEIVSMNDEADVYLINTCTVTGTGDQKSMKLIRKILREHPFASVICAGCLAQRDPERVMLPGVRLVIGVQQRKEVVSLLRESIETGRPIDATKPLKGAAFENLSVSRHEGKTRATMKIQEGCDRYCAYCIIPYVRGPVRSMDIDDIRAEAKRLACAGYRELVITGIHLASYGRQTGNSLIDAIRVVNEIDGVNRIRLGSLEPYGITEEFAKQLRSLTKVCPQFHLSLQSGSAGVLERMRRRYTPEEYLNAVRILRDFFPDCAITTDIIAGFPGETDEEFEETVRFIQKVRFARIHVFPYSRRSGTVADRLPDHVPEEVKKLRAAKLIEVGNRMELEYVQSLKGTYQDVLFETEMPDGTCEGYTACYVRVRADEKSGEMKRVLITDTQGTLAIGRKQSGNGGE